jgi:uncharacterized protein
MLPALAVAHSTRQPAVSCWLRPNARGRVAVLLGGSLTAGADLDDGRECRVNFPAGSRAIELTARSRTGSLARIAHWEPITLNLEVLARDTGQPGGLLLEDLFALLPDRPMAVAAVGYPLSEGEAQPRIDHLSDLVERLQPMIESEGSKRLAFERAISELRYLETWAGLGLWELQVFVGAANRDECRAVAGLLSATSNLMDQVLRMRVGGSVTHSEDGRWSDRPIVASDVIAALLRSPTRELPGIRVVEPLDFDVTPEVVGGLRLGDVLDATRSPCMGFDVPTDSVNRHVFVTGATGSGKSQTVRTLLGALTEANIPWLVIEPAKAEYAAMAGRIRGFGKQVTIIRPGQPDVAPASLNPLEPTSIVVGGHRKYFNLQTHVDLVRALFTAAFDAQEPFPQILASALNMSYERLGWNLALGRAIEGDPSVRPRFPTLGDLQLRALEAVDAVNYGKEVRDNVRGFMDVRIGSLRLGTPARFFENGHPLDLEKLLKTNTVFEIEDLGDDNDKAFFMGTVLIRVVELLRLLDKNGQKADGLRHVTVIEEAHRLLRNVEEGSPAAHAVSMFANLLAEVRAYGEGLVVAEQIPAKVIPDVVKNSAVKVLHRLPAIDDRLFVGSTMNLSESQSAAVVALSPGVAVVHSDGMDRSMLVAINGAGRLNEDVDEVPPTPPVHRRGVTCSDQCKRSPCTLEDLVLTGDIVRRPAFVLWCEVVTLAHLTGDPAGVLTETMRKRLVVEDRRRLRCAIGIGASAAVIRRSRWVRRFYDPSKLELAVTGALCAQVRGSELGRPDVEWQIGRFRWADVRRVLDQESDQQKESAARYPQQPDWVIRGLSIPPGTWRETSAALVQAHAAVETPFTTTFLGDPNAIDPAASELGFGSTRGARLQSALGEVLRLPNRWPAWRLYSKEERGDG